MHHIYSEECKEVKNKVERSYQKAKAKHAKAHLHQKLGKMSKIDDATRIKYILLLLFTWLNLKRI